METNTNQEVHVSKEFPVPVDVLYNAWVSADALKSWWSPMGHQLKEVTNELKEGGRIAYVFGGQNSDTVLVIEGLYSEVKDKERLVYSWNWQLPKDPVGNSEYRLSINFSAQGNGSKLDITQENLKENEAVKVHEEGWEQSLNDLHQYLSA